MGDRYAVSNQGATDRAASTTQAAGALLCLNAPASPTRRGFIYDLLFGTSGSAADVTAVDGSGLESTMVSANLAVPSAPPEPPENVTLTLA